MFCMALIRVISSNPPYERPPSFRPTRVGASSDRSSDWCDFFLIIQWVLIWTSLWGGVSFTWFAFQISTFSGGVLFAFLSQGPRPWETKFSTRLPLFVSGSVGQLKYISVLHKITFIYVSSCVPFVSYHPKTLKAKVMFYISQQHTMARCTRMVGEGVVWYACCDQTCTEEFLSMGSESSLSRLHTKASTCTWVLAVMLISGWATAGSWDFWQPGFFLTHTDFLTFLQNLLLPQIPKLWEAVWTHEVNLTLACTGSQMSVLCPHTRDL